MEGYQRKDEKCLELLDLIASKTDGVEKKEAKSYGVSEEEKLELRLGPPDSSQTRERDVSFVSVVGWPPIRSLRKNRASSSFLKPSYESQNVVQNKVARENPVESSQKGLFVKINMDGVPIGRKVDLKACDTYKKLSSAVDELFRGLLAAQNGTSVAENGFAGLIDGRGEYALVYEDNEGERKLVRDVQWHVFVSTVKRLRVSKISDMSLL